MIPPEPKLPTCSIKCSVNSAGLGEFFNRIGNQPPQPSPKSHSSEAEQAKQGTKSNPFVVQVISTSQSNPEASPASETRNEESANWWLVKLTAGLILVGGIQAWVFWIQARRLRDSIVKMDEIAKGQTEQMAKSIAEATRSADAMKDVANGISLSAFDQREFWKKQMRAYLSVGYVEISAQNRENQYNYDVRLVLKNNEHTPAYDVMYTAKSDVLPRPLPGNYDLSLPHTSDASKSVIGPGQQIIMNALLPRLYNDDEISGFTFGANRIHVWGEALYKDTFGDNHTVKFCQYVTWYSSGKTTGTNTNRYNESD